MKKIFTVFTALFTASLMFFPDHAQAQNHKIVSALDSNDYTYDYYYDAQNRLVWMEFGTTRREYNYNEAGQLTELKQYAWVDGRSEFSLLQTETYEYGNDGNVARKVVVKSSGTDTFDYSDYENGVARKTVYNDRDKYFYDWRTTIEYNADQTIAATRTEELDRDFPEDGYYKLEDYEYTYADGYRDSETKIAYKYDGSIRSTLTTRFTYADVDAKFAPANLKASGQSTVTLTWDAVEGATGYVVTYDMQRHVVEGCSFTTTLGTGTHTLSVRAEVDGALHNASFVTVESSDAGKLPVASFCIGDVYETVEETESEEAPTRTFINIPLSWTLTEGHSEVVKYNIYYDSKTYGKAVRVSVTDPAATSFLLKVDPFEVADWDEEGKLTTGLDVPIFMTVVYTTGESENSEVITINPFKLLGYESGVMNPVAKEDAALYSIQGLRIAAPRKGIYVRGGKKFVF